MLKNIRNSVHKLKEQHQLINSHVEAYFDESADKDYLGFFTRILNKIVHGERSSIFINDPNKETVWLEVGTGVQRKEITVPSETSMVGRVIASGKAEINDDLSDQEGAHQDVDSSTGSIMRNAICVPVKSLDGKEVTGAIQVLNKANGESFNEEDQKWLEDIARNIQFKIEHVYLQQESMSVTDKVFEAFSKLWSIFLVTTAIAIAGLFLYMMSLWLAFG